MKTYQRKLVVSACAAILSVFWGSVAVRIDIFFLAALPILFSAGSGTAAVVLLVKGLFDWSDQSKLLHKLNAWMEGQD